MVFLTRLSRLSACWLFRGPFARRFRFVHRLTMRLFRYAADRGDRDALTLYGSLLHFRGADQQSRSQGALYLACAAEQGDSKALWLVAGFYERGLMPDFQKDAVKARDFYLKAADRGHPLALAKLEAESEREERPAF